MPKYKHIIAEQTDAIAWVKLNRVRYRNAQSQIMLEEMDDAFEKAGEDDSVRVKILAGEGDYFSSEHDLGTRKLKEILFQEAVRKLTSLPAESLGIPNRGLLKKGYYADIAILDPDTIGDKATFKNPHHYSNGMRHVIVNRVAVHKNDEHTNATPGMIVRGAGWTGKRK